MPRWLEQFFIAVTLVLVALVLVLLLFPEITYAGGDELTNEIPWEEPIPVPLPEPDPEPIQAWITDPWVPDDWGSLEHRDDVYKMDQGMDFFDL
jgi:hypothetical protein